MSRVENYSFSGYPSSYDTTLSSTGSNSVNNGLTDVNSTTYARFTGSSNEERRWYYAFNTSSVSQFANITDVKYKVKVTVPRQGGTILSVSLSNLTEDVSTPYEITNKQAYTTDDIDGGQWSVNDLENLRLKLGLNLTNKIPYFFGANLYINYSITWYSVSTTSSVAGISITSSAAEVESGNSVTLTTNASSLTGITIKDNDVDVTSNFTGASGNYRYTLTNVNADHSFTVTERSSQGSNVFIKGGGNWNEASAVYKKISGSWVQQTDTQNIFTDGVYKKTDGTIYVNGNN